MSSSSRPALGRGLSALIPKAGGAPGIENVDIDLIAPNPHQPRTSFDAASLQELAESIREHGVLQPVIVTQVKSDVGMTTYQLIAGERRLQAAKMAGIERMPVVVKEAADAQLLELALVENLQRLDLNAFEEALAFKRLSDDFGMTQEQVARRIGRSRASVANTLRLLALEDEIRTSLLSGQITEGHARALLGIDDSRARLDTWRSIINNELSVRQAEEIAKTLRAVTSPSKAKRDGRSRPADPHLRALEDELRAALGARVSVAKGRTGGRIVIRFHNDDELQGIVERLRG